VPALVLEVLNAGNAGNAPAPAPAADDTTDARNGFTVPTSAPVACGRSPTPTEEPSPGTVSPPDTALAVGKPVGCVPRPRLLPRPARKLVAVPAPGVDDDTPPRLGPSPTPAGTPVALAAVSERGDPADEAAPGVGVVGADCGIGGSASSSDAPNDDVGLNALTLPPKPVVCGRNGMPVGWLDNAVLPVGCPPSELKMESEKVEPVIVVAGLVGVAVVAFELKEVEVNGDVGS
jgi:hypothetical protein